MHAIHLINLFEIWIDLKEKDPKITLMDFERAFEKMTKISKEIIDNAKYNSIE